MNITVLLGGVSAERDVSLSSGLRIAVGLRERGHTVICLDPADGVLSRDTEARLLASGVGSAPPSLEALAGLAVRSLSPTLATKTPPRSKPRQFRPASWAATFSVARKPGPARPPPSSCR